jgi:hypothetical protein
MAVPYSFFEVYLAVHPKDLPSGRPQVRDRHLKFHEDRDNLTEVPGIDLHRLTGHHDATPTVCA